MALAQLGLTDLISSADLQRQIAGIATVIVMGRAVTQTLEHIKTFKPAEFALWWKPYADAMESDPLCVFMKKQRNALLKEGTPPTVYVLEYAGSPMEYPVDLTQEFGSTGALPGIPDDYSKYYKSSHIQTQRIRKGEFASERTYVPLPTTKTVGRILSFPNSPTHHMGSPFMEISAQSLCATYVQYLANVVRDTKHHFSPPSSASNA